jgi:hypothetical protein
MCPALPESWGCTCPSPSGEGEGEGTEAAAAIEEAEPHAGAPDPAMDSPPGSPLSP